jgi:microcin C transport system substrate-binding protein
MEYIRNPDYWGKDLPVNKGRYNFDRVIFEYFMNDVVEIEAFKAQESDLKLEHIAKNWATAYNNIKDLLKVTIKNKIPVGMQAYVFNTRKAKFADYRVRKALSHLFDFDWINKYIFFGMYKQSYSYFANTEYAAQDIPQGAELEILKKYQQLLPEELYSQEWKITKIQNLRENLIYAKQLLEEAGWYIKEGQLVNIAGEQMTIEFLSRHPAFEKVSNVFAQNLERLGIKVTIRTLGSTEYIKRINNLDFDIIPHLFRPSPVPGREQILFWHSSLANIKGGNNIVGVASPVVDDILELLTAAQDIKSVIVATRALDRVLLWSYYVIPQWYQEGFNVVYWDKFGRPEQSPDYDLGLDTWWAK